MVLTTSYMRLLLVFSTMNLFYVKITKIWFFILIQSRRIWTILQQRYSQKQVKPVTLKLVNIVTVIYLSIYSVNLVSVYSRIHISIYLSMSGGRLYIRYKLIKKTTNNCFTLNNHQAVEKRFSITNKYMHRLLELTRLPPYWVSVIPFHLTRDYLNGKKHSKNYFV